MPPLIQLQNFSYAYPQVQPDAEPVWVLDGVDLTINAGEFVAIMGRTGGGKTTLCLALNGIVPHSTSGTIGGNVLINGQNSREASVAELAQTVGLVFQEPETQLFNMTVEAEVAFGLETVGVDSAEIHNRIDWALNLVGMSDYRQHSPFDLSGGQKQRVAIAAILAMKPPVLVLDEPTANLDPIGKRDVFAVVETLRQQEGMTIIMVSHEAEQIANFADRLIILADGKVAFDDTPAAIFSPADKLSTLGLATPQVSQLAQQLNDKLKTDYAFVQLSDVSKEALTPNPSPTLGEGDKTPLSRHGRGAGGEGFLFALQNITFSYNAEKTAVNNVSLTIDSGEFVAILGQNGSGKTTLAKHLNGLLQPTSGQVLLDGADIADRSVADLAQTIGYVFQNPDHMIFSPTVREEVSIGPRNLGLTEAEIATRVDDALAQFDLTQYADQQPASLSFGLRRKVSVAAVVAMQTDVLILDEPTSGLDQRSSDELMTILSERNREGHSIILITHDMRLVAQYVPRCIVMHDGRLLAHDDTRSIFAQPSLLEQTQLEAPQITRLGQQLGLENAVLTIAEMADHFTNDVSHS